MKKLFLEDPYQKECEAVVEAVNGNEITVDQSVFFAFSGGQASDKGTINSINVTEAVKSEDKIVYVLEQAPDFKEGDKVKIEIDWEYRYKIMKLHSAAHIVYMVYVKKHGKQEMIGSNVSADKARIDFLSSESISERLPDVEKEVNELIKQDKEIKCYADEQDPEKRWWQLDEEKMPCGGTHIKKTLEIGAIKLKRKNIGAGKERIEVTLA